MDTINRFKIYKPPFKNINPDKAAFGERLGVTMTSQHKSIPDLGAVVGVSYEMSRRYVTGTGKPPWDKIARMAKWLKVDPDWLCYGVGEPVAAPDVTVPIFDLSAKDMPMDHTERITPNRECLFAVRVGNPMGSGFKEGDMAFMGAAEMGAGDKFLIRSLDPDAFVTHLIRTVKYNNKMKPCFVADDPEYPDISIDDYTPVAKVVAILSAC